LVADAVNVTDTPLHTDVADALILTEGVTEGRMTIATGADEADEGTAHDAFDVMTHLTVSLLLRDEEVSVAVLPPTTVLFIFH
jgi:hypothetical protein